MIDFPASPTTGQLFTSGALSYRYDGHAWLGTPPAGVMTIPDAPNDGVQYGRQSQAWTPVTAGGGGGVWIGDTAPTDTTKYPFWWSSTSLQLSIWYNDGNSSQWVDTNGAPSSPPGAWLLQDGTVTAPGLAWANEPGLGLYRKSTSVIGVAAQGSEAVELDASGAGTYITAYTKSNAGAQLRLFNNAPGAASFNYLNLYLNPDGNSGLVTNAIGGAPRAPFTLAVPQVLFPDGTVAAPGISFASEAGLGLFRAGADNIGYAAGGVQIGGINASSTTTTFSYLFPRTTGSSNLQLWDSPPTAANVHILNIGALTTGYVIQEQLGGTAPAQQLTMTFPVGVNVNTSPFKLAAPAGTNALLTLVKSSGTANIACAVFGYTGTMPRWGLYLGNPTAEAGVAGGSDFHLASFDNTGSFTGNPLLIVRATGQATFQVAIVNGPSDRALKGNIAPIDNALAKVLALQGVSFNMLATPEHREIGFIANDVQPVVPEVIQRYDDKHLALDYPKITALLVEAVKELAARL